MASNLTQRILVALVAVPVLLGTVYLTPAWVTWCLIFFASVVAMYEVFTMTLGNGTDRNASLVMGALAGAGLYWIPQRLEPAQIFLVWSVIAPAIYYLFRFGDMKTVATRFGFTTFGIVYVGGLFAYLSFLRREGGDLGRDLLVFCLLTAWLSDTGGYFAGKYIGRGRGKLYPAVSPNKTWAGAIGGVVAALASALLWQHFRLPMLPIIDAAIIAVVGSILGQLGDLTESMLKRACGVKDSGNFFPGHGGMLDRVDALIFIAPFMYLYLHLR